MTASSWEETKANSLYHFDSQRHDPRWDCIQYLGRFSGSWDQELAAACQRSEPATWATRGYKSRENQIPTHELIKEHNDLTAIGMDVDAEITDLHWDLAPVFAKMSSLFGLQDTMTRLHVQWPGQVWNLHIDKLQKWNPAEPSLVRRIMIHLQDWQPGHFWGYGNYVHTGWHMGDITTFDWQNVPHCTANAGRTPRCTLQVTGVETASTRDFLQHLQEVKELTL